MGEAEKKALGIVDERTMAAAERFLERRGYEIVQRGYECEHGRADLSAWDADGFVVLVEVKEGGPGASGDVPDEEKRARWEQVMACYLAECGEVDVALRWDVVRVQRIDEGRAMISHLVNAWSGLA